MKHDQCNWDTIMKICHGKDEVLDCYVADSKWKCENAMHKNCVWPSDRCGDSSLCFEFTSSKSCKKYDQCNWDTIMKICHGKDKVLDCDRADSKWKCNKLKETNPKCYGSAQNGCEEN